MIRRSVYTVSILLSLSLSLSLSLFIVPDPIKEIQVSSIWQSLNEDVVVDSEVYTDLDPVQAPLWTVHLELNDQVGSMLIKSLCTILDHCRSAATTEQLLGKNYTVLQSPGMHIFAFCTASNVLLFDGGLISINNRQPGIRIGPRCAY